MSWLSPSLAFLPGPDPPHRITAHPGSNERRGKAFRRSFTHCSTNLGEVTFLHPEGAL